MSAMPNIVPISELRQDASGIVKRASGSGDNLSDLLSRGAKGQERLHEKVDGDR